MKARCCEDQAAQCTGNLDETHRPASTTPYEITAPLPRFPVKPQRCVLQSVVRSN